jgi:hypothetical protein
VMRAVPLPKQWPSPRTRLKSWGQRFTYWLAMASARKAQRKADS